ncbi:Substrate-specific component BioY of biotin ECF transporter [Levilactobacillus brevis]|nr:Substrate-specific component BioY of biotin ECF transporter [Levilactobacillus brevis]
MSHYYCQRVKVWLQLVCFYFWYWLAYQYWLAVKPVQPYFWGLTGEYLVGWLIMPLMLQGLTYGRVPRLVAILLSAMGVDILGAVWLSTVTTMSLPQALVATLAFIPGDSLKAVGAWWLAQRLRKWAPKMI